MKCTHCNRESLSPRELSVHVKYYHGEQTTANEQPQKIAGGICPECGSTLFYQEGCTNCQICGFSKCG